MVLDESLESSLSCHLAFKARYLARASARASSYRMGRRFWSVTISPKLIGPVTCPFTAKAEPNSRERNR